MSQPAFSMRIRNLEARLDTRIVKRGNRYLGLTEAGEAVVAHARTIVGQARALEEEVRAAKGEVMGALALGVVPTAATHAAFLANRLYGRHPGIRTRIETANSLAIHQGVEDGRFDAGITYTEGASTDLFRVEEMYRERYVLLAPATLAPVGAEIRWAEAAGLPLVLLDPGMQNRRILDRIFETAGVVPEVVAEVNGFTAAMAMAALGMGATVVPGVLAESLGAIAGTVLLPLVDPTVEKSVSLVTPRRAQAIPVVEALRRVAVPEQ